MNKNKELILRIKDNSLNGAMLSMYADGTYQYANYIANQYSYWSIRDGDLYFRHYEQDSWIEWHGLNDQVETIKYAIHGYFFEKQVEEALSE